MSDSESGLPTSVDCISPALREVLAVFDDEALADVKFPDVDNDALQAQAAVVEERHAEVRRLEAALEDAKRKLDETHDSLLGKAQRAVAYARVYADGDPGLTARLDAIALPRGRPRGLVAKASSTMEVGVVVCASRMCRAVCAHRSSGLETTATRGTTARRCAVRMAWPVPASSSSTPGVRPASRPDTFAVVRPCLTRMTVAMDRA